MLLKFTIWYNCSAISFATKMVSRAGFKPIWPISSNRAPRRRGPINQHRFALCIEADSEYFRRGALWFSRGCERPKWFLNYSNGLSKQFKVVLIHENLALQSSQYSDKTVAVSRNVFAGSKVKSLKNLWRGPQHFVSSSHSKWIWAIFNENPSVLRGF